MDYKITFRSELGFSGKLATTRQFYREHPRWLAAQLGVILLTAALGIAGLFVAPVIGGILLVVSVAISAAALRIPSWRESVEERRLDN